MWVYFPYAYIYPEQYHYMLQLKHALDANVRNFFLFIFVQYLKTVVSIGILCVGNAYRNR